MLIPNTEAFLSCRIVFCWLFLWWWIHTARPQAVSPWLLLSWRLWIPSSLQPWSLQLWERKVAASRLSALPSWVFLQWWVLMYWAHGSPCFLHAYNSELPFLCTKMFFVWGWNLGNTFFLILVTGEWWRGLCFQEIRVFFCLWSEKGKGKAVLSKLQNWAKSLPREHVLQVLLPAWPDFSYSHSLLLPMRLLLSQGICLSYSLWEWDLSVIGEQGFRESSKSRAVYCDKNWFCVTKSWVSLGLSRTKRILNCFLISVKVLLSQCWMGLEKQKQQ